jgi:hypothetical protein
MTDVFDNAETQGESKETTGVEALVGEDKKFKTVDDLVKGKLEADSFIEQLQEENKVVREKIAELEGTKSKEATLAELLQAVKEHQKEQGDKGDNQLSDDDLSKRIKDIMQGETEAQTRAKNRSLANQTVLGLAGGDSTAAAKLLADRAKQLQMSVKELTELGERSPEAFTKLITTDASNTTKGITALEGQINTDNSSEPSMEIDGHKTKAYYSKLKAEIGPAKYWNDIKIQGQYAKDAMALRERF